MHIYVYMCICIYDLKGVFTSEYFILSISCKWNKEQVFFTCYYVLSHI